MRSRNGDRFISPAQTLLFRLPSIRKLFFFHLAVLLRAVHSSSAKMQKLMVYVKLKVSRESCISWMVQKQLLD